MVICPNCGSQNAAGNRFCGNCGQLLEISQAPRSGGEGGGGGRMLAIGAGFIALLLIAGLATAAFLGVFNGPASSGLVGVATPSPSALASGSGLPTLSPGASASLGLPSIFPSDPPSSSEATRTPRPTCDINGAPRGCRPSPMPTPTSQPTPTAEPTPISCAISTAADRSVTLTTEFPTRTIPQNFAWCVHDVTFTNASLAGATGTLKLFLENPEYIGPPGNYGMAKIGWPGSSGACEASIATDFASSTEYHPACTYPFGYDSITEGTIVSFEIVNCGTNGTCGGSVTIEFERIEAP